jgi:NADH dehydrogenase [ubiquinone] 1 alpha subcomplex assembly factor 5
MATTIGRTFFRHTHRQRQRRVLSTKVVGNHHIKRIQRNRTANVPVASHTHRGAGHNDDDYEYLRDAVATALVDRLDDMKHSFPLALDYGSGRGHLYRAICAEESLVEYNDTIGPPGGIGGIRKLVQIDSAEHLLTIGQHKEVYGKERCDTYRLAVDNEEDKLPFPAGTFDLVLSSCALHRMNDLPAVFKEIHRVLKPDGCFLFATIGGTETLAELRIVLQLAELERRSGMGRPRVGPFTDSSDLSSLLQQSNFKLLTVDIDTHKLAYPNAAILMEHLRRMGESNTLDTAPSPETFLAATSLYEHMFRFDDESVEATVQVIYGIGWTPHSSHPQPLARGTATHKI